MDISDNFDHPVPDFAAIYDAVSRFEDSAEEFERIIRRIYEAILCPGDGAIDIGAHLGKHSLPLALCVSPSGTVVAVEPIPWAFQRLAAHAALVDLPTLDVRHGVVASEVRESVTFQVVPAHPGWSSISARPGVEITEITVRQTTVDRIVEEIHAVRFIKIDVEGAEPQVLDGARETLSSHHPVVHIEVSVDALEANGHDLNLLRNQLTSHGYLIFDLLGNNVSSPASWSASALAPGVFDYIAAHPDQNADVDIVRGVLARSFPVERLDISAHGITELLGPAVHATASKIRIGDPTPVDLPTSAPQQSYVPSSAITMNTIWPQKMSGIRRSAVVWDTDGPAVLLDFFDGSTTEIDGIDALIHGESTMGPLAVNRAVRIEVNLQNVTPGPNHQTIAELNLPDSQTTGLVRIHKNGRIEVLWLSDGYITQAQGTAFSPGPVEIVITRRRTGWHLTCLTSSRAIKVHHTGTEDKRLDLALGYRRFSANPDPLNLIKCHLRITNTPIRTRSSTFLAIVGASRQQAKNAIGPRATKFLLRVRSTIRGIRS